MHFININVLYSCITVYLMKRKPHEHPKFFLNASIEGDNICLLFQQNQFDEDSQRIILKEKINKNSIDLELEEYLTVLNKNEYIKLKKYLHVQKRVLHKHEKSRNYDACKIVKNSIIEMNTLKKEFEDWFLNNKVII